MCLKIAEIDVFFCFWDTWYIWTAHCNNLKYGDKSVFCEKVEKWGQEKDDEST